jgi:hypothetical protein
VLRADGRTLRTVRAQLIGDRWVARVTLQPGQSVVVSPGGIRDSYGETNAAPIGPVRTS